MWPLEERIIRLNRQIRLYKVIDKLEKVTNMPGIELMYTRHHISILIRKIEGLIVYEG